MKNILAGEDDFLQIPASPHRRVVIAGGGFAGLEIIKSLKHKPLQVVLFDRHNYFTFQPLLYQVATSGLEANSVAYPYRRFTRGGRNLFFRMAEVEEIDAEHQILKTSLGCITYDYLILATGSMPKYFGLDQHRLMPLKSVPDALKMRNFLLSKFEQALEAERVTERRSLLNVVVVGGGPTGVELAGALAEMKKYVLPKDYPELDLRGMNIYLLEGEDRLLPAMSREASEKSHKFLVELGVTVLLKSLVKEYDGEKVSFGDQEIPTKNLIWTAGVKANLPQGIPAAEFKQSGRVAVDRYMRVKGYNHIYAVGDLAWMSTPDFPDGHPMLAPVAMQQGQLLAENLLKLEAGKKAKQFEYNDKGSMATVGRNRAVVDLPRWKFQGAFAWFVWMFVHLMSLVGFRNRVVVFINWMYNYFTSDRALRLIIRLNDK